MAELNPKDQLALHEFSVRYRAAYAEKHPLSDLHLETIQDAVRGQYEVEQDAKRDLPTGPQSPAKDKDKEPEAPEP